MAIAHCDRYTPEGVKHDYTAHALPIGYHETSAICGRVGCEVVQPCASLTLDHSNQIRAALAPAFMLLISALTQRESAIKPNNSKSKSPIPPKTHGAPSGLLEPEEKMNAAITYRVTRAITPKARMNSTSSTGSAKPSHLVMSS